MSKRPPPWTTEENTALVALYFTMLDKAIAGKAYNKAGMIREAQGIALLSDPDSFDNPSATLRQRSRGSIEAKLMNATAAHLDVSRSVTGEITTMAGYGYVPLANYQASLKDAMRRAIEVRADNEARSRSLFDALA